MVSTSISARSVSAPALKGIWILMSSFFKWKTLEKVLLPLICLIDQPNPESNLYLQRLFLKYNVHNIYTLACSFLVFTITVYILCCCLPDLREARPEVCHWTAEHWRVIWKWTRSCLSGAALRNHATACMHLLLTFTELTAHENRHQVSQQDQKLIHGINQDHSE